MTLSYNSICFIFLQRKRRKTLFLRFGGAGKFKKERVKKERKAMKCGGGKKKHLPHPTPRPPHRSSPQGLPPQQHTGIAFRHNYPLRLEAISTPRPKLLCIIQNDFWQLLRVKADPLRSGLLHRPGQRLAAVEYLPHCGLAV